MYVIMKSLLISQENSPYITSKLMELRSSPFTLKCKSLVINEFKSLHGVISF